MNKLEDSVIKYQINFERYKNGQANEVIALLDNANKEIAKYIKRTDGVYTKARYKEISKKLKDVSKSLKESIGENTDIDGLIDYELKKQKKLLNSVKGDIVKAEGGEVNFIYPTKEQVKTAALFKPVADTMTYDSYLNGIEAGLYNTWDSAIRTGYLTGQTTQQIVKNVMGWVSPETKLKNPGMMNSLRNSVYGNTRTVLQSFANETRNRVYEENEEYFGDGESDYKYEWLSTLDSRTCLVCGDLDGKLFRSIKDAPQIPAHRGCRCILLPYFNIEGNTRASKDGYTERVTFNEWLGKQDEKTQKEVLGATRFKLYQDGVKIAQFVDNGEKLTLDKLYEMDLVNIEHIRKMTLSSEAIMQREKHIVDNPLSDKDFEDYSKHFKERYDIRIDKSMKSINKDNADIFFKGFENVLENNSKVYKAISELSAIDDDTMFMQQNGSRFELNKKYFSTDKKFLQNYINSASADGAFPKNSTLHSCIEHEITHFYEELIGNNLAKKVFYETFEKYEKEFVGSKKDFIIHFQKEIKSISKEIFSNPRNFSDFVAYCRQDYVANKKNCSDLSKIVYNVFTRYVSEFNE